MRYVLLAALSMLSGCSTMARQERHEVIAITSVLIVTALVCHHQTDGCHFHNHHYSRGEHHDYRNTESE